jgi:cell division protein FtsI/penicillin-binding protein 2
MQADAALALQSAYVKEAQVQVLDMMRSRQSRIKNYLAENRLFTVRSIVAGIIAAVLLLSVAGRLFYLQVVKYQYYSTLSQGNSVRNEPIPPSRGLILDRHGVVLANNQPAFNLELVREPKIAVAVLVENGGFGGSTAAVWGRNPSDTPRR